MQHSALLNVMMKAARKAARQLVRDFGEVEKLQVSLKGPANFVTAADRRAEETLRQDATDPVRMLMGVAVAVSVVMLVPAIRGHRDTTQLSACIRR